MIMRLVFFAVGIGIGAVAVALWRPNPLGRGGGAPERALAALGDAEFLDVLWRAKAIDARLGDVVGSPAAVRLAAGAGIPGGVGMAADRPIETPALADAGVASEAPAAPAEVLKTLLLDLERRADDQQKARARSELERAKRTLETARKVNEYAAAVIASPPSNHSDARRGDAFFYFGRYREALECYERALLARPADWPSHFAAGECAGELENYGVALLHFDACVRQLDAERERSGEPRAAWEARPEVTTRLAAAYSLRGRTRVKLRKFADGLVDCREAVRLYRTLAASDAGRELEGLGTALAHLGTAHEGAGGGDAGRAAARAAYDEAVSVLAEAARADPNARLDAQFAWVLTRRAALLRRSKDKADAALALADLDRAVSLFDASRHAGVPPFTAHAWALALRSELSSRTAVVDARRALAMRLDFYAEAKSAAAAIEVATCYLRLGDLLRYRSKFAEAREAYSAVLALPDATTDQKVEANRQITAIARD
jgi:tetratricopeptide (TPR) repeat protein